MDKKDEIPSPGDTVLIALMSELRRTGILSSKEMLNIMITYLDISKGTPVEKHSGFVPLMLCMMAIAKCPELDALIERKFPGMMRRARDF